MIGFYALCRISAILGTLRAEATRAHIGVKSARQNGPDRFLDCFATAAHLAAVQGSNLAEALRIDPLLSDYAGALCIDSGIKI